MKKWQSKNKLNFKPAFTLAEVLITLAIIGVVASLTIPTVVRNYQERETVTKVKKFYSDISQAFQMATVNKGKIENYGAENSTQIFEYFKPYLKVIKECEGNDTSCFYNGDYKTLYPKTNWYYKNPNNSNYHRAILGDGSSVWFYFLDKNCELPTGNTKLQKSSCASVGIDINGFKAPNRLGVDTFYFRITKYGIYPIGLPDEEIRTVENNCDINNEDDKNNGYACTAWIIVKGNMDYLKKTVSW